MQGPGLSERLLDIQGESDWTLPRRVSENRSSLFKWSAALRHLLFFLSRLPYGAQIQEALVLSQVSFIHMIKGDWCSSLPLMAPTLENYKADCDDNIKHNLAMMAISIALACHSTAFTFPVYLKKKPSDTFLLHPLSGMLIQATRIFIALGAIAPKGSLSLVAVIMLLGVSLPGVIVTVSYERLKNTVISQVDQAEKKSAIVARNAELIGLFSIESCQLSCSLSCQLSCSLSLFYKVSVGFFVLINSVSSAFSLSRLLSQWISSDMAMVAGLLCTLGNLSYLAELNDYVFKDYHDRLAASLIEDPNMLDQIPLNSMLVKHPYKLCFATSCYRSCLFTIQAIDILNQYDIQAGSRWWYGIIVINGAVSIAYSDAGPGRWCRQMSSAMFAKSDVLSVASKIDFYSGTDEVSLAGVSGCA